MSVSTTNTQPQTANSLDRRLDSVGWALFLLLVGGLWLAPEGSVPDGAGLLGFGAIVIVLSAIRWLYQMVVGWFWPTVGILALVGAISAMTGRDVSIPVFPILLVAAGLSVLTKTIRQRNDEATQRFADRGEE